MVPSFLDVELLSREQPDVPENFRRIKFNPTFVQEGLPVLLQPIQLLKNQIVAESTMDDAALFHLNIGVPLHNGLS